MPDDKPSFGNSLKGIVANKLDEAGLSQQDYVKAALKWQYNWIGLAGAAAFALVSGTGLPIVLAAGIELMYVALVPQSSRFRRLVRSWKYASDKRAHEQRLADLQRNLPVEMQSRHAYVQQVAESIRVNYKQLPYGSQVYAEQMDVKLAGLLDGYVRLLYAAHTQREYLQAINPEQIRTEVAWLEKQLDKEPLKVQEINRRRIEIGKKRVEKYQKIAENRKVIDAQCAAIEDVLQLIRDQSISMRDPQEVSAQLDHLVADVEQTEQSVREMEEIFAMTSPDDELRLPPLASLPNESAPSRNRVRN
jgi:hypothetical protein